MKVFGKTEDGSVLYCPKNIAVERFGECIYTHTHISTSAYARACVHLYS